MKTRILLLCAAIVLVLDTAHAEEKTTGESLRHPPQTEAEKAVDEIVKMSIAKPDMFPIILQNPGFDLSKTKEFEPFFTEAFLIAWRQFEKKLVKEYCEGKYQTGKKCGYDVNPIACDDPLPAPYFYRTIMGDDQEALVALATPDDRRDRNTYYMKRDQGRWKLGGLYCDMDTPYTTPEKALMKKFRQPNLESERKLEEIFQVARARKDILPFILDLSWRDRTKDVEFSPLFTPALLRAWKRHATAILEKDCSDEYPETGDGNCDFFDHPIFCHTEEVDLDVSRSSMESGNSSLITYSYPGRLRGGIKSTFRMSKNNGGWKLDGVDCNHVRGWKYNMP